jgi:hypothetical protein
MEKEERLFPLEKHIRRLTLVAKEEICLPANYPYRAKTNQYHNCGEDGAGDELCRGSHWKYGTRKHNA